MLSSRCLTDVNHEPEIEVIDSRPAISGWARLKQSCKAYENLDDHPNLQRSGEPLPLLQAIFSYAPLTDVLIVDDRSPDGTGELADELQKKDVRVHVLHRAAKLGLGTAYLAGFKFALAHVCQQPSSDALYAVYGTDFA